MASLLGTKSAQLAQIVAYQLVGQVVAAALTPFMASLTQTLLTADPVIPLEPAALASAVVRGFRDEGSAAAEAQLSGVNSGRFNDLVKLAGSAPAPAALAEALRRELIDAGAYAEGIKQNDLRPEWANLPRQLAVREPTPESMLNALLQGQVDQGYAQEHYRKLGGDPAYFKVLFDSQGQAPTPTQALELANRGIIEWGGSGPEATTYEQAFLEGPWRNKWLNAFQKLGVYLPPPRTITAMYREGSLTQAQAAGYLADHGLSAELAAAYLSGASGTKMAHHKLASESTVVSGYEDGLLDQGAALGHLTDLGYADSEAAFVLAVADARVEHSFLRSAVSRVSALYIAGKIDRSAAAGDLSSLQVPPAQAETLLAVWDHARAANVKTLTPAQIMAAFKLELIDAGGADSRLRALGYTSDDALLLMEIAHKGPLGAPS